MNNDNNSKVENKIVDNESREENFILDFVEFNKTITFNLWINFDVVIFTFYIILSHRLWFIKHNAESS